MRFTVHGPGIPAASPRSHGVPRRDVPGRVHVRVACVSAGGAPEGGLALARLRIHLPARRTTLARERGIDLLHSAGRLLLQPTYQKPPTRPKNAPVEPSLLADISARILRRASGGSGHVPSPEIFYPDHVETACDVSAGLLCPVLAPVHLADAQPGSGPTDPRTAFRAAAGAGESAFQAQHASLLRWPEAGYVQHLSCGERRTDCYAPVDTDRLIAAGRRDRIRNGREGDVPAPGPIHGHPVGPHPVRHSAGPAEPHPADLGYPYFTRVPVKAPHPPVRPAPSHDSESLRRASRARHGRR